MAVNKNFVVKNGLEVNTNLLVADLDTQTVGIGTTIAPHELHVIGGIGVTNLLVTGVATIGNLRVTGPSTFIGVSTFVDGNVHIQKSLFVNGINITGGSGGSIGTDLHIQRHVRAGGIVTFSDSLFVGSGLGQSTGTSGQVLQVAGVSSGAYFGGQVGIGTTNPAGGGAGDVALHVVGDSRFVGLTTFTGITTFQSDVSVQGSLKVTGDITYDEITGRNLNISGLATFQSLTQNRVAIVGAGDTLNDTNDLRFADNDLSQLVLGVGATVGGGLTASSVMVEDLTNNRVVIAGTDGELEDDANFTFDGTQLVVGVGATVGGALTVTGDVSIGAGTPAVKLQVLDTINSSYSASNAASNTNNLFRIENNSTTSRAFAGMHLRAHTADVFIGVEERDTNLGDIYFNKENTELVRILGTGHVGIGTSNPTGNNAVDAANEAVLAVGIATARKVFSDSLEVGGSQVISSARQLQNIASLDSTTTATIESAIANAPNTFTDIEVTGIATFKSTVKVEDLAPNRVVFVGAGDSLTDDANFTFDRSQLILGVGATVGGALTVAGIATFASAVGIAESIFHVGDPNTSFGFPAADTFTVDTGGSERLRIDSNGEKDIKNGPLRITSTHIAFSGNVATPTEGAAIFRPASDTLAVSINNEERLRVSSGGDVGIGTTNPERRVEIHDSAATVLQLNSTNANGTALRIQHNKTDKTFVGLAGDFITGQASNVTDSAIRASGALLFATGGGTERVRVSAAGSVGIGSDGPENALDVAGDIKILDNSPRLFLHDANATGASNATGGFEVFDKDGNKNVFVGAFAPDADNLILGVTGTERLRVTADGDVGIGTITPTGSFAVTASNEAVLAVGIVTARQYFGDGSNLTGVIAGVGIRSDSTTIGFGVTFIDFIGPGIGTVTTDTNSGIATVDVQGGGSGGGSGVTETDTTVSTTNPTGVGSFATASFRSASVIAQINQLNTDFQVGRYLMIHDGTTVTVVEESAVSTGSTMLGSFTGVIDGSNVELRVTLASAGVSTVTTKIDTVTV